MLCILGCAADTIDNAIIDGDRRSCLRGNTEAQHYQAGKRYEYFLIIIMNSLYRFGDKLVQVMHYIQLPLQYIRINGINAVAMPIPSNNSRRFILYSLQ